MEVLLPVVVDEVLDVVPLVLTVALDGVVEVVVEEVEFEDGSLVVEVLEELLVLDDVDEDDEEDVELDELDDAPALSCWPMELTLKVAVLTPRSSLMLLLKYAGNEDRMEVINVVIWFKRFCREPF